MPQLFTSHRFTDGEEIELLVIDRIQVPYRLLKSKFATINSPKQPTRINYPKRPTAINSFPLQLDPGQNAIKISRFIYVSDNEITSNFSYLLRLWKKVKNQRKKEHDITAQISHILDKSLKSTDFKNGEDIRLMLATLLECLNGVEKSLLIIKESKFNDPQLESLIAAKTQTLDAVRQIVVSFEERVNAFEYLRVAHDLESLEKFRLELNKMPIAQASNGPHNVADFGTWKTYRSKTIENAKKESERQLHLLLVFFKEDDEDDSVDFSPDLFVNAISQESRILNNFDPPIETIMSVLLDAIKSKEVLMASMKEVERVFESLRHISSEWKSVRDADHSMQEYDSRYEKMIDIFGDLQKQTKNRRRAEGVLEQLTKSYRIACQAVDEEYLRLYTVGSKFFPELLLELREVCETDDLISFSRHFGSYEEQEVLYSAKHKVYRAKYQGVDCVLKEFRLDEKKDLSRFLKESRTISKLDHPNIIKIQHSFVDDGDDSKRGFLQIPFYSEGDLFKLMTSGTELTLKKRQTIAQGIMLGLEYLHRHNIIHCDLKPQNILMDGVNKPVISDFDNSFDTMEIHINTTLSTLGTFRVSSHLI